MKLTLGELTSMASLAGIDMYTAWGVSDDALLAFTKSIVERCAAICETPGIGARFQGDVYAAAIRNLLEAE